MEATCKALIFGKRGYKGLILWKHTCKVLNSKKRTCTGLGLKRHICKELILQGAHLHGADLVEAELQIAYLFRSSSKELLLCERVCKVRFLRVPICKVLNFGRALQGADLNRAHMEGIHYQPSGMPFRRAHKNIGSAKNPVTCRDIRGRIKQGRRKFSRRRFAQ